MLIFENKFAWFVLSDIFEAIFSYIIFFFFSEDYPRISKLVFPFFVDAFLSRITLRKIVDIHGPISFQEPNMFTLYVQFL